MYVDSNGCLEIYGLEFSSCFMTPFKFQKLYLIREIDVPPPPSSSTTTDLLHPTNPDKGNVIYLTSVRVLKIRAYLSLLHSTPTYPHSITSRETQTDRADLL